MEKLIVLLRVGYMFSVVEEFLRCSHFGLTGGGGFHIHSTCRDTLRWLNDLLDEKCVYSQNHMECQAVKIPPYLT